MKINQKHFSKIGLFFLVVFSVFISGCSSENITQNKSTNESENRPGNQSTDIITSTNINTNENFLITFFDADNYINYNGESFDRSERLGLNSIKPAESYMIRSGNVEVLVDAGYQTGLGGGQEFYKKISENNRNNLLKKIAANISEDGVLDYLVVTHADFDHIAALATTAAAQDMRDDSLDGILDSFYKKSIIDIGGRMVQLQSIKYIIDFDSDLVRYFSDNQVSPNNLFLSTDIYKAYITKRDLLVSSGTVHVPAANLFKDENKFSLKEKTISMPTTIKQKIDNNPELKANIFDGTSLSNSNYNSSKERILGNLALVDGKYFYEIPLNGDIKLQFLYNWHYDFVYKHSFDSKDRNNIAVIIKVVANNFSFISTADGTGDVESSLINYYGTEGILTNIDVFKVAHHGSVVNGENSQPFLDILKPKIFILTTVATVKISGEESYNNLLSVPLTNALFANIKKSNSDPVILCTNISGYRMDTDHIGYNYHESVPFYGDIFIERKANKPIEYSHSYKGVINAYINSDNASFNVITRNKSGLISLQNTNWFKEKGLNF